MPGNLGLWDQTRALLFLHNILPDFGGDPERITLSGQSAGSASVSAHLFSPHSDHLFSQAIQFSGSLFSEWAINDEVVGESKELAKALHCDTSSSEAIHECMKKQDFEAIMDKLGRQPTFHASPRLTRFNPRVDNDFFPYKLEDMVRKAPKKKTLNFVTDMESAIFVVLPIVPSYVPREKWTSYTGEDLLDYIRDNVVTHDEFARRTSPFFIELRDFYLYRDNQNTSAFYLTRLAELISDLQFNVPIVHEVELKRLHGWDTYFAVIDYESETTRDKDVPIRGAVHSAEHRFIFKYYGLENVPMDENDKKFKHHLLNGILSFIKTGEPKSGSIEWPKVSDEHPMRNLRVRPEPVISDEFRPEAIKFWTQRVPEIVGHDLLKKTRLPSTAARQKHTEL
ncbi:hypothetical protein WR25_25795 isoform B [Diploscapter pachys]|nr:hypothetical protein WR25_25795 isoform B [Diploscapter pachys]